MHGDQAEAAYSTWEQINASSLIVWGNFRVFTESLRFYLLLPLRLCCKVTPI